MIGTGPRLQMLLDDGEDDGVTGLIEREFAAWARAVDLSGKLRTMRMSRAQDGEAFGLQFSNDNLDSPVKLDIKLIEADQVATPSSKQFTANCVDGIVFDEFGNPREYHILDVHPGDSSSANPNAYRVIPAASVIHWFRADRPGQSRGLPDILPALPLITIAPGTLVWCEAWENPTGEYKCCWVWANWVDISQWTPGWVFNWVLIVSYDGGTDTYSAVIYVGSDLPHADTCDWWVWGDALFTAADIASSSATNPARYIECGQDGKLHGTFDMIGHDSGIGGADATGCTATITLP